MSSTSEVTGRTGAIIDTGGLGRFIPEPKSRLAPSFSGILNGVRSLMGSAASSALGINPDYQDLLNKQIEVQTQMQLVTLESNLEKSRHETQMAAVRNVRVG